MDQSDIANLSMTCKDIYERITASPLVQAQLKKLRKWRILLEKGREYAQKNPHEVENILTVNLNQDFFLDSKEDSKRSSFCNSKANVDNFHRSTPDSKH